MKYVDKLLQETEFLKLLKKLEQLEENREFCRHGLTHLLDTARLAWIQVLEQRLSGVAGKPGKGRAAVMDKEMIYLAALLHDLGRILEYEEGISHHEAGAVLAEELLLKIGYPKEKSAVIVSAVHGHRGGGRTSGEREETEERKANGGHDETGEWLKELLFWADKKSRNCFFCKAQSECSWSAEKRNDTIEY